MKPHIFEQLQLLKFDWKASLFDLASANDDEVEAVETMISTFAELVEDDEEESAWDTPEETIVMQ